MPQTAHNACKLPHLTDCFLDDHRLQMSMSATAMQQMGLRMTAALTPLLRLLVVLLQISAVALMVSMSALLAQTEVLDAAVLSHLPCC